MQYYFVRKHKAAFAPVKEPCYSLEQAMYLASHHYGNPSQYDVFEVASYDGCNWKTVKNFLGV